jgi:YHS domain-containing protein
MAETSRRLVLRVPIVAAWCALCGLFSAAEAASSKNEIRIALDGYDPVAYFTDGHPVKGSQEFTFAFDDAVYYFNSAEHRAMFAADPDRYAPQYSGYCAVSVSIGKKVHADPEAWIISDGKLFVFGGKEGVPMFAQDSVAIVRQADAKWPTVRNSP